MTELICDSRLKKQPSSLYNTCIRYVARNLKRYKHIEYLEVIPPLIKNALILNVTRIQRGFHDDELLEMLLNGTLTRINFSSSTITDRTLLSLAEKCPNLKSLILTQGDYRFSRRGLEAIVRQLKHLQQLSVRNCALVDDELVALLARNCPRLDLMDLECCTNVTDRSADAIKRLKLTKLNLSRTRISDQFLMAIANEECGCALEDLNVGHCRITGAGLGKLPWDTIKYIGFEGCEINDLDFIGTNKNLKYIQWTISN
ncbi:F-box/LRR-repeat protein 15 [Aedes albopictus]|uniref:F-box/LRR-repeat protein 15-like leucin rich repeat domain-containing protein n=1 Tax=Aedes albopictus TaxID=7160 RepID=A0ABM1YV93_AEDAL|nr:F-box/LRR-repeat protein 15-like [Aedes albopictus]XP_029731563.1 F-box/LRR-repeat protein 15-like [Aedes albopictus]